MIYETSILICFPCPIKINNLNAKNRTYNSQQVCAFNSELQPQRREFVLVNQYLLILTLTALIVEDAGK